MTTNTFTVTLRNIPISTCEEICKWCYDHLIKIKSNLSRISSSKTTYEYSSYSFTSDTDAMLFKLTFSEYL
jgi:hypothetical protein